MFSQNVTLTLCPFMSLPGLVFEWIELFSRLSSVFLCHALPHVFLVVLCKVFLKPCCGIHCPNTTHKLGRTARQKIQAIRCRSTITCRAKMGRDIFSTMSNQYSMNILGLLLKLNLLCQLLFTSSNEF